jgi:hypothetical protein
MLRVLNKKKVWRAFFTKKLVWCAVLTEKQGARFT